VASPLNPADPHPALRATFSQREKESGQGSDLAGNPCAARTICTNSARSP